MAGMRVVPAVVCLAIDGFLPCVALVIAVSFMVGLRLRLLRAVIAMPVIVVARVLRGEAHGHGEQAGQQQCAGDWRHVHQ
jgi:hypothetical protein